MATHLPLDVTINKLTLSGFGPQSSDTADSITNYYGGPLYCHADASPTGHITITLDENAPNSFTNTAGPVTAVQVSYQPLPTSAVQTIQWTGVPAGLSYKGRPLDAKLVFSTDLSTAELVVTQRLSPSSTEYSLGIVIVGSQITGGSPEGHFVNVPFGASGTSYSSMGISWTNPPPGSIAGPIGGGTVP